MSSQERDEHHSADHEHSMQEKQQSSVTKNEEELREGGPKFYPPVYRQRYAAVCELVKKHQAKKVSKYKIQVNVYPGCIHFVQFFALGWGYFHI